MNDDLRDIEIADALNNIWNVLDIERQEGRREQTAATVLAALIQAHPLGERVKFATEAVALADLLRLELAKGKP